MILRNYSHTVWSFSVCLKLFHELFITPRKHSTCWWKNKTTCSQLASNIFWKLHIDVLTCPHVLEPPELLILAWAQLMLQVLHHYAILLHFIRWALGSFYLPAYSLTQGSLTNRGSLFMSTKSVHISWRSLFWFLQSGQKKTLEYHIAAFNYEAKQIGYGRLILFISSSYTTVCLQGLSDVSEAEQIHNLQW